MIIISKSIPVGGIWLIGQLRKACWTTILLTFSLSHSFTKAGFCHIRKNLLHVKNPELFLRTPSATRNICLRIINKTDKLRCSVLCIHSTSDSILRCEENFQVPPFQQHSGILVTVSITPSSVQFTV